jgi:hypothetical protein
MPNPSPIVLTTRSAVLVRRTITFVVLVIAGLSFAFGFGNGYLLGLQLGVSGWIAPLVAPAVDLSVIGLLACLHYVRTQGITDRLLGPRAMLVFCGGVTFALNTARPILAHQVGRACFDAVAPCLLIGWSEVGPQLLTLLHQAGRADRYDADEHAIVVPAEDYIEPVLRDGGPSAELLARAQELHEEHREATGRNLSRDQLRAALGVSNATAGELVRLVRTTDRKHEAA